MGIPDDDSLYVTVRVAAPSGYDVVFATRAGCIATYCRVGHVTGRSIAANTPLPNGRSISLPGVAAAVFQHSVCGANCSDAVVTWDQGGARYTVGLQAGELDDLRRMASSVERLQ